MTSLGELKLEYNNDAMKLKKNVLQAKTHIINNLAKKSKKFKAHKGPDEIKAKFEKKAESYVSEIQLLKKVKYNDLVRFAMTNNMELSKLMNTPIVTMDKVMAKLISHKALKSKIDGIKNKFKEIPISELLEPNQRKARRKMIKEKRAKKQVDKEAKKQANKNNSSTANAERPSNITESDHENDNNSSTINTEKPSNILGSDNENDNDSSNDDNLSDENNSSNDESSDEFSKGRVIKNKSKISPIDNDELSNDDNLLDENSSSNDESSDEYSKGRVSKNKNKISPIDSDELSNAESSDELLSESELQKSNLIPAVSDSFLVTSDDRKKKIEKDNLKLKTNSIDKMKNKASLISDKNKKIKEKILIDLDDVPNNVSIEKTVDSFFVTESGDDYMTMALPRPPDDLRKFETNNERSGYSQGNRKMRRAAMFGNEEIITSKKRKPNVKEHFSEESRFSKKNSNDNSSRFENSTSKRNIQGSRDVTSKNVEPPEKLHPSWEAKKQISSIVGFQGKKTVFDD